MKFSRNILLILAAFWLLVSCESKVPTAHNSLDLSETSNTEVLDLYEYRDLWAEESGGTNANVAEWSFGNGDVGVIGLPFGEGWEVTEMWFDADVFVNGASIEVDLVDMSSGGLTTISSISVASPTDGGGQVNNTFKLEEYATPIALANTSTIKIGFTTRAELGNISSARVGARLRHKVGEYLSLVDNAPTQALLPPCGSGQTTFFNEQQFSWGFAIQNTSNTPINWQFVISGANYQVDPTQLTNNTDFTYSEIDNGNGTFELIFTAVNPLPAFGASNNYQWSGINFGFNPNSDSNSVGCN